MERPVEKTERQDTPTKLEVAGGSTPSGEFVGLPSIELPPILWEAVVAAIAGKIPTGSRVTFTVPRAVVETTRQKEPSPEVELLLKALRIAGSPERLAEWMR